MEVYLDNSATTKCSKRAADIMMKVLQEDYGNPSSMHQKGVDAEKYIVNARRIICKELKINDKELLFTSGGTESNNMAIIGTAFANIRKGKHIITTQIEHPSVKNPMIYLEEQGYEITRIPVDKDGIVNLEKLQKAIREDTILVSVMHVNNEIGSVQPLKKIADIIKAANSQTYFHVDCVQGIGKFKINPKKTGIDLLSASGHKFHGPKGVGFLYIGENVRINPILFGGGQQKNMRSGTENVPAIAGMAEAFRECYENLNNKSENLYRLRNNFIKELEKLDNVIIHGSLDTIKSAPHIISASFIGVRSEVMLHTLESKGIYVSAGSACSSHKRAGRDTLTAIGLSKEEMESNIRFSLDDDIEEEHLQYCLSVIREVLPMLRKYQPH